MILLLAASNNTMYISVHEFYDVYLKPRKTQLWICQFVNVILWPCFTYWIEIWDHLFKFGFVLFCLCAAIIEDRTREEEGDLLSNEEVCHQGLKKIHCWARNNKILELQTKFLLFSFTLSFGLKLCWNYMLYQKEIVYYFWPVWILILHYLLVINGYCNIGFTSMQLALAVFKLWYVHWGNVSRVTDVMDPLLPSGWASK